MKEMIEMNGEKCPICGEGTLKKTIGPETFTYKGEALTVPDYVTYACPACDEAIVDNISLKESGKLLKDFQRKVDNLLTGEQIKAIRKKLGLTQEELAEIIGGGKKALARYESGKVCQSRGMDNLLRILDACPYTLRVLKKDYHMAVRSEGKVLYPNEWQQKGPYYTQTLEECSTDTKEAAYG